MRASVDGLRRQVERRGQNDQLRASTRCAVAVGFARQHEITQILIGPIHRSWPHIAVGGRIVRRVFEEAAASGIDVLIIARRELPPPGALDPSAASEP